MNRTRKSILWVIAGIVFVSAHAWAAQHNCSKTNIPYCNQLNVCASNGETWTKGSSVTKGSGTSSCGMGYSRYESYNPSTLKRNIGCYKVSGCVSGRVCEEQDSSGNSSYYCVLLSGGTAPTNIQLDPSGGLSGGNTSGSTTGSSSGSTSSRSPIRVSSSGLRCSSPRRSAISPR